MENSEKNQKKKAIATLVESIITLVLIVLAFFAYIMMLYTYVVEGTSPDNFTLMSAIMTTQFICYLLLDNKK